MKKLTLSDITTYVVLIVLFCLLMQGWEYIISFLGLILGTIIPLVLGVAIAYIVSIPTNFFERHFFPNSESKVIGAIRRPVCLLVAVLLIIMSLAFATSVLVPALMDVFTMVQTKGQPFVEEVIEYPVFKPVKDAVKQFIEGDFMQSIFNLDVQGIAQGMFGGTVGSIGAQVFGIVSMVMTTFFGILFSFMLLTDTSNVGDQIMIMLSEYLGPKHIERLALVVGVADASFHNFIVRQCVEGAILGTVGTVLLLAAQFPYALGVGVFMGMAALIPIMGYPIGLFCSALMIAIAQPWLAVIFVAVVAVAQVCEATLLLPHIGDPRTTLAPVWITVGVTIGGGVAGFAGMLVAIPIASTIYQLIKIDIRRRQMAREKAAEESALASEAVLLVEESEQAEEALSHPDEPNLS